MKNGKSKTNGDESDISDDMESDDDGEGGDDNGDENELTVFPAGRWIEPLSWTAQIKASNVLIQQTAWRKWSKNRLAEGKQCSAYTVPFFYMKNLSLSPS